MLYGQGKAGRGEMVIIYSKKVVGEDQRLVKEKKGYFLTLGPLHTHAYTTPHPTTHTHTHTHTLTHTQLLFQFGGVTAPQPWQMAKCHLRAGRRQGCSVVNANSLTLSTLRP